MKILRVIHSSNPKLGGVIEAVRLQQVALEKLGFEVQIISCDDPSSPWILDGELPVLALGPAVMSYGYTSHLQSWIRENVSNFDAVIIDGLWQYHSFAVWKALSGTGIPYYVFPHGMLDPWFKYNYPLKHLKKWFYWPWAEYRVLRDACKVIFTCEEERLLAKKSFWMYKVNEEIASLGVSKSPSNDDNELVSIFLRKYSHLQGKRIALFLSRIHEKKGVDLLIRAFAKVAHCDEQLHLVIAGPGQEKLILKLKELARSLDVEHRITWTGMLRGEMKWGAFYASEVFCLPSHQENFGIVVAESLACGKPVLISNKVNIWREIELEKAGFVAEDNLDGTTRNFKRWLGTSKSEFKDLQSNTLKCFESRFHIKTSVEQLINILKKGTND
jgi:glycosyltransferase involved in cell wall biosynthesis